jgi:hypothetical protein
MRVRRLRTFGAAFSLNGRFGAAGDGDLSIHWLWAGVARAQVEMSAKKAAVAFELVASYGVQPGMVKTYTGLSDVAEDKRRMYEVLIGFGVKLLF